MTGDEAAVEAMRLAFEGRLREHRLVDVVAERGAEDDVRDFQSFRDFLPTRNGCLVFGLTGRDDVGT